MILTCPACSAQYMVSAETIGDKGRAVRCAKCKHEWVQKSEKDSLDELISRIQSVELDEIGFEDHPATNASSPEKAGFLSRIIESALAAKLHMKFWLDKKLINFKGRFKRYKLFLAPDKKTFGGMASALVVFSVLFGAILLAHSPITHILPQTKPIFEELGIKGEQEKSAAPNPEDSLAFDRLAFSRDSHDSKLSGTLLNLSKDVVTIPIVTVQLLDKDAHEIYSRDLQLKQAEISGEDQIDFELSLGENIPKSATKLEIRFTDLPLPDSKQEETKVDPHNAEQSPHHSE